MGPQEYRVRQFVTSHVRDGIKAHEEKRHGGCCLTPLLCAAITYFAVSAWMHASDLELRVHQLERSQHLEAPSEELPPQDAAGAQPKPKEATK